MTQEDLEQIRAIVSSAISENNEVLFAAMRAIEEHVDRKFDEVYKRLDHIEQRLEQSNAASISWIPALAFSNFKWLGSERPSLPARSSTANYPPPRWLNSVPSTNWPAA